MRLRLAHYRNRFCMFRTYYALRAGLVRVDGLEFTILELPDPPSRELEAALIRGDVDVANLYLPNFLERRLEGAPIIGLCTEWKSTGKGNGLFVRRNGIRGPADLEGGRVMTHQGRHAIHQYLLTRSYSVDCSTLTWSAGPQEALIGALRRGEADAVVLLDQFFHHGERSADVECLYTDGAAWKQLTAFDEMIKHIVAVRARLILQNPALHCALIDGLHQSLAYSEQNMNEIADVFIKSYGGDREDLLASARYPRMEFTFTETERRLTQRQMEMFVEVGRLPRSAPVESFFVSPS